MQEEGHCDNSQPRGLRHTAEFLHVSCAAIADWFIRFAYGSHEVKHFTLSLSGRGVDEHAFLATCKGVRVCTWTVTTAQVMCGHPPPLWASTTSLGIYQAPIPKWPRPLPNEGLPVANRSCGVCHPKTFFATSSWWSWGSLVLCGASWGFSNPLAHLNF